MGPRLLLVSDGVAWSLADFVFAGVLLGNADDAPGLVLFGLLLIAGTVALSIRTAQRSE